MRPVHYYAHNTNHQQLVNVRNCSLDWQVAWLCAIYWWQNRYLQPHSGKCLLMACENHHCKFDVNPMWTLDRIFHQSSNRVLYYTFPLSLTISSLTITAINLSDIDKHSNHQSHNIRLWFLADCVLHVLSRFRRHKHCIGWTFEWLSNFNNNLTCQRLLQVEWLRRWCRC